MQSTDVAIIGAGPIGIELAVALKKRGVDYLHFDAKQVGYTISWFAPQTQFFSSNERIAIAGVPLHTPTESKASREQYLAYLRGVVEQFDLKIQTYEPITNIQREGNGFVLTSQPHGGDGTRSYQCKRIVLATGGTDRPRLLNIPGENLPHVSHYFDDPHKYFRKELLIVGGRNSAVEAALRCHHAGARVSISYRREGLPEKSIKYWLLPEILDFIKSGRIGGHFNTEPLEIKGSAVTLSRGSERFDVPADFVLLLVGYEQDTTLFKMAGIELAGPRQSPVFDDATMESNIKGIYLAGTAIGGTQDRFTVFIENCHVHVSKIVAALTGQPTVPTLSTVIGQPES
ncbi:MAG TPA: NAD(P)-binding domain-containing protein [Tepidisphaeraceae bacterium]|nr:NAD(P)-binding domain-containing protein [Tepidisphaeraceae bacterium]